MENINEEWKPVKGYEGYYEISNYGNVKSVDRIKKEICRHGGYRTTFHKGKYIKQFENNKGYYFVRLSKSNAIEKKYLHRLVAEAFIPNPENKPEVDHIDGKPQNNNIKNLQWATHKENLNNPIAKQRWSKTKKGKANIELAIPVYQYTIDGKFVKKWYSAVEAGENGFSKMSVWKCCNNKQKNHKGFIWKYL